MPRTRHQKGEIRAAARAARPHRHPRRRPARPGADRAGRGRGDRGAARGARASSSRCGRAPARDLVHRFARGIEPRDAAAAEVPIASDPLLELAVLSPRPLWVARYADSKLRDPHLERQGVDSLVAAPIACGEDVAGAVDRPAHARAGAAGPGARPAAAPRRARARPGARDARRPPRPRPRRHARAPAGRRRHAHLRRPLAGPRPGRHGRRRGGGRRRLVRRRSWPAAPSGSRLIAATPGPIRDALARQAGRPPPARGAAGAARRRRRHAACWSAAAPSSCSTPPASSAASACPARRWSARRCRAGC